MSFRALCMFRGSRTVSLVLIVAIAFCIAAGIGAFCRFEYGDPAKTCILCHEIRGSRDRWSRSPHKEVDCKDCHGGTLESLGDNIKRGVKHVMGADYARLGSTFCLSERQVEDLCDRCAKCHRAETEQWARSGHGKSASEFLQDEFHNAAWKPADHCLRCHGMFLEGEMSDIVKRKDLASRRAIPCTACHRIHSEDPLQLFSRGEWTSFPAANLHLQRIFTPGGREVRRSPDAQNRLCANCHAANAEGVAGSSDDRTPLGGQEGMSCTDCHKGHDMKADPSRGRCPHPQSASRRKRKEGRSMTSAAFVPMGR